MLPCIQCLSFTVHPFFGSKLSIKRVETHLDDVFLMSGRPQVIGHEHISNDTEIVSNGQVIMFLSQVVSQLEAV